MKKEEEDKIWSRVPKVGRKNSSTGIFVTLCPTRLTLWMLSICIIKTDLSFISLTSLKWRRECNSDLIFLLTGALRTNFVNLRAEVLGLQSYQWTELPSTRYRLYSESKSGEEVSGLSSSTEGFINRLRAATLSCKKTAWRTGLPETDSSVDVLWEFRGRKGENVPLYSKYVFKQIIARVYKICYGGLYTIGFRDIWVGFMDSKRILLGVYIKNKAISVTGRGGL
jgi:hypothetical protein